MQVIPLGKITVATAGTPVPITAALISAAGGQLPPNGGVAKIAVRAVHGSAGVSYVKSSGGTIIASLEVPASGHTDEWCAHGPAGGNVIIPNAFALDVATSGDGAYVTVWVD